MFKTFKNKTWYIYIIVSFITIGSTSFLSYTFDGYANNSSLGIIIRYLRLPLTILGLFFLGRSWLQITTKRFGKEYFFLFLFFSISVIFSGDLLNSIMYLIWFVSTILFIGGVLIKTDYYKNLDINDLGKILIYSNCIVLLLVIPSIPTLFSSGDPESVYFTSKNTYVYPIFIILTGTILVGINKKPSFLTVTFLLVLLLCLLLSGKRLIFLVSCFLTMVFLIRNSRIDVKILFILLFLTLGFAGYGERFWNHLEDYRTIQRLSKLEHRSGSENTTDIENRAYLLNAYLRAYKENPIYGLGYADLSIVESVKVSSFYKGLKYHNSYLAVLVETGILGFLSFVFIIIKSAFKAYRVFFRTHFYWWLAILFCFLLSFVSETQIYPGEPLFLSFFTFLIYPIIKKNRRPSKVIDV